MRRRRRQAAAICRFLAVAASISLLPLQAQSTTPLGRADIQRAIEFGETRIPEPYRLRHWNPAGGGNVVVGFVYTPFVRLAFLSRAAKEAGRHLDADDVEPEWIEPVAYIAFRWYCYEHGSDGQLITDAVPERNDQQVVMLPLADGESHMRLTVLPRQLRTGIPPLWLKRGTGVLERFGAEAPENDVALVAAFPLVALDDRHAFAIFRQEEDLSVTLRVGVPRPEEVGQWR